MLYGADYNDYFEHGEYYAKDADDEYDKKNDWRNSGCTLRQKETKNALKL